MAGLGGKNWTFQEEVTSSDVNGYLADQVVMRFANSTARTAGFGGSGEPTLAEGMMSYLDDANRVDVYDGSVWKPAGQVLQVAQTVKSDTSTTASTSYTDLPGLSVSITPYSSSSKILVQAAISQCVSGDIAGTYQIVRGSTAIGIGDAAGSRTRATFAIAPGSAIQFQQQAAISFLDSPATTSSTTYKIQFRTNSGTLYVNRTISDTDSSVFSRTISTITVMEIAG